MGNKRALVFGASGFIGGYLLDNLLSNEAYTSVIAVVRRAMQVEHPKLTQYIGNLESLPSLKHLLVADDIFCAIGTTKKKTPDRSTYYQIDHDFPVAAAEIGKENGAKAFFFVSSVGADPDSSVFYIKTKGETEKDIIDVGYDSTHIFRPAALTGDRKESRPMEKVAGAFSKVISPILFGSWKKFRPIKGQAVANAMIRSAQSPISGVHYYYWEDIAF